jgi:hypothetical protein
LDPDPKLGGKWDPDPKKIVTDPQHWLEHWPGLSQMNQCCGFGMFLSRIRTRNTELDALFLLPLF